MFKILLIAYSGCLLASKLPNSDFKLETNEAQDTHGKGYEKYNTVRLIYSIKKKNIFYFRTFENRSMCARCY